MKKCFLVLLTFTAILNSCKKAQRNLPTKKPCTLEYIEGEILMLPIQFKNFPKNRYDFIKVYQVIDSNNKVVDSFPIEMVLWTNQDTIGSNDVVDHNKYPSPQSPWNNCNLIFKWGTGHSDTLKKFDIRYSRFEDRKECHKDDPYVRIDKVEYYHKNKKMGKNDKIVIEF